MAALSVLSALSVRDAVVASSVKKLFFGDSPAYERYVELSRTFANDRVILVAYESDVLFTPDALARLDRAAEALAELPDVVHVDSLASAYRLRGRPGTLAVDRVADLVADAPEAADEVRAAILEDPLYRNLVVSADGRAAVLAVELVVDEERPAEQVPLVVEGVLAALEREGFDRERLHLAGMVAASAECVRVAYQALLEITPFVMLLLLLLVWWLFRRLWPVLITSAVALLGVLWTMGFAVLIDRDVNILLAMVPAVVLVISFSDVIHLISAYLQQLARGLDKDAAIRSSAVEVGRACVLTSATTFCGFASMMLVPTPVFRQLGLVLGVGVAVALLIAVTLVPVLFHYLPAPRPAPPRHSAQRLVSGLVGGAQGLAARRPWAVIGVFAVVAVVLVIGLTRVRVETDFVKRLSPDNPLRVAELFYGEHFAGTASLDVYVSADEPGGLRDPAVFARVAALQDAIAAHPAVGTVRSLVDLVARIHREMNQDVPDLGRLPDTRGAIAQYLLLFEMAGGGGLERLADPDGDHLRLGIALPGTGFRHVAEVAAEIDALAREQLAGVPVRAEVTGISFLFGDWLDEIVGGQRDGLGLSIGVIAVLMVLGLRSLRVGLWSMVPNVFPLLALGGLLGWIDGDVDSDTMIVAMIGIGIGVDDTIHFLSRLRIEWGRQATVRDAVNETFRFAGVPIVLTTIILGLGFMPLWASDYYSMRIMGTLLPFTLVVALLADLLLAPALVEVGWIRFPRPETSRCADRVLPLV